MEMKESSKQATTAQALRQVQYVIVRTMSYAPCFRDCAYPTQSPTEADGRTMRWGIDLSQKERAGKHAENTQQQQQQQAAFETAQTTQSYVAPATVVATLARPLPSCLLV